LKQIPEFFAEFARIPIAYEAGHLRPELPDCVAPLLPGGARNFAADQPHFPPAWRIVDFADCAGCTAPELPIPPLV
jgi:hypothetical protein